MERNITKVKILGAEYQISCPPEESKQVKEAAIFFDKRLKEIKQKSKLDESKAAIIAGLNISNDYLKNQSSSKETLKSKSDIKKLTSDIEKHLESISKFDN
jgi:cell division protein ZapA (FtsZ GTPase activity inhibitor)